MYMVLEKICINYHVFPQKKSMEAKDPQGVANLDPRDIVGRTNVGDY